MGEGRKIWVRGRGDCCLKDLGGWGKGDCCLYSLHYFCVFVDLFGLPTFLCECGFVWTLFIFGGCDLTIFSFYLALILLRTLRKDYARYALSHGRRDIEDGDDEDIDEDDGKPFLGPNAAGVEDSGWVSTIEKELPMFDS